MLVDSHCHLNFPDFQQDLDEVVARAQAAGVDMMVSISTRLDEAKSMAAIASKYASVVYSVGVHPHEVASHAEMTLETLLELARAPKVVGLGETGLDFYFNRDYEELQKQLFSIHIEASRQTGLPVIIHSRGADDEMIELLTAEKAKGDFPALIHCFTSNAAFAKKALELGLYISLSGILTFKNAEALRDAVEIIPVERLLVETDSPYLAPMPNRGKRNEPAYVVQTAEYLAKLKSTTLDDVARITSNNFYALFTEAKKYRKL